MTELTEKDFLFDSLKEARAKIKDIRNNQDHRNTVLLNLWSVFEGYDEGINTKFEINRLDQDRF